MVKDIKTMKKEIKKRHKWGNTVINVFTEQQTCKKCNLVRFKALGIWRYSKKQVTIENPFPDIIENEGCKDVDSNE